MRVVLFHLGNYPVRSYGLIIAIAILLGIGVAHFLAKGTKYYKHIFDLSLYLVVGAIIGARVWEVFFFEWGYYSKHLSEIISIWNGGMSIQGSLIGGLVSTVLFTWRRKLNFWELADILAPAVVFGQAVGRVACLLNGDAFGSPTGLNFGLVFPKGTIAYETYGSQPLWPAEVWEGQWDLVVFGILLLLKNTKWPKGFLFLSYNILYSLGRFMLEFLRGDTPRYLLHWTAAQWTSVVVILISFIFLMIFLTEGKKSKKTSNNHSISMRNVL